MKKSQIQDIYTLTPLQKGMLFHSLDGNFAKNSTAFICQESFRIKGNIQIEVLKESSELISHRYDVIRTAFIYENLEQPLQVVLKDRKIDFSFEDISNLSGLEKESHIVKRKNEDRERIFDLVKSSLVRITVIKFSDEIFELIWSCHHIILDGWSFSLLQKEFLEIYESLIKKEKPNLHQVVQFKEYIKWYEAKDSENCIKFWSDYLSDYSISVGIPKNKTGNGNFKNCMLKYSFQESISEKLENFSREREVTLNTVFNVIWGLLICKINNTNDCVFGITDSVRPPEIPQIDTMVGIFINTYPIRIKYTDDTFCELLDRVNCNKVPFDFSVSSLAEIQSLSDLKHNLLNHLVVFENYPSFNEIDDDNSKDFNASISNVYSSSIYDFNLAIVPGKRIVLDCIFNEDVYSSDYIRNICEMLEFLAFQILSDKTCKIDNYELLSEKKKVQISQHLSGKEFPISYDLTVIDLFENQVQNNPHRIAITYRDKNITYKELNLEANKIAASLIIKGVKLNSLVAVCIERGIDLIKTILGILKAGGAYLPIDIKTPHKRIQYILNDSNADFIIFNENSEIHDLGKIKKYILGSENKKDTYSKSFIRNSHNPFYLIYTSGTTGNPKGVIIKNRGILNMLSSYKKEFGNYMKDSMSQVSSPGFDAMALEIWPCLINGLNLVILDYKDQIDTERLVKILIKCSVSLSFQPTAIASLLMKYKWPNVKIALHALLTGGEKLSVIPNEKLPFSIFNLYGPTEDSVWTTFSKVDPHRECTLLPEIGIPIMNKKLHILDRNYKEVPPNMQGELFISGIGLSEGYLNDPEKTHHKFILNPNDINEKLYSSGDIVRLCDNGQLEFIGRKDNQVKIRGYRIELSEIEFKIKKHYNVIDASVQIQKNAGLSFQIIAFVVYKGIDVKELQYYLQDDLPEYMFPSIFVTVEKIPLNKSGKVDVAKLFQNVNLSKPNEEEFAKTVLEEELINIWSNLLNIKKENINVNSDYFELGGHSLLAADLMFQIQQKLKVKIAIDEVFRNSTIKKLANHIEGKRSYSIEFKNLEKKEYYCVSAAQKRLYITNQFKSVAQSISYNIFSVFKIIGSLNLEQLETKFIKIIERHEALRTYFIEIEGDIFQVVKESIKYNINLIECHESDIEAEIRKAIQPFDLNTGPLFRISLIQTIEKVQYLLIDMHHIIADGLSTNILLNDFIQLSRGNELVKQKIQYKDYAYWENTMFSKNNFSNQEKFWKSYLEGFKFTQVEFDEKIVKSTEQKGLSEILIIKDEKYLKIKDFCDKHKVSRFIFLLSVIDIVISKETRQRDICIGFPIINRDHYALKNLVGIMLNLILFRTKINDNCTIIELIKQNKITLMKLMENKNYPYEKLARILKEKNHDELISVYFNYFTNTEIEHNENNYELNVIPLPLKDLSPKYDLNFHVFEGKSEIELCLVYKTPQYANYKIKRILKYFSTIIDELFQNVELIIDDIALDEDNDIQSNTINIADFENDDFI